MAEPSPQGAPKYVTTRKRLDKQNMNSEPGMGDVNVMVKPSSLKDKTPMCLINELARYNKILHQYRLTKEEGPPHRKKFTVTLKLGNTEFEATGTSIKKAQHEAAAIALRITKYEHPPPKLLPNTRVNTTPTVELNALAMKRGELTTYTMISQPAMSYYQPSYPLNYYPPRNSYQPRSMYNEYCYNDFSFVNGYSFSSGAQYNNKFKCPAPFKISLKIGGREYFGEGNSAQMARHNAAKKALEDLRNDPKPNKSADAAENDGEHAGQNNKEDLKSPISTVHEKAFRHNSQATFEVVEEKGPPHMRTFVTECRVGDKFKTVGEGNGKKISKRRAAEKMLELLDSLPTPPRPTYNNLDKRRIRKKLPINKRKPRIIRDGVKPNENEETNNKKEDANPITKLMEYQKKQGKEPVYVVVDEKGRGRKKQFSIEVTVGDFRYVGIGNSKKDAKRQASEGMLELLGLAGPAKENPPSNLDSVKKEATPAPASPKPVVNGKQIAPGLLLVPNANITAKPNVKKSNSSKAVNGISNGTAEKRELPPQIYTIGDQGFCINLDNAKDQLMMMAFTFGYEVQFSDFPKGHHHQEFLSLVTINTNPPQTCYGSGDSTDTAQNEAAFNALSMVNEMGAENFFSKKVSSFIPENEIVS